MSVKRSDTCASRPSSLGPTLEQREIRRAVTVGDGVSDGFSEVSTAKTWWRAGHFDSPTEARGAFRLSHQQALDGMGEGVAHWMGLTESEFSDYMRSGRLPCDVMAVPADGCSRVYFLRDRASDGSADHVKIGTSTDVTSRVSSGQVMNPRELVLIGSVLGDRALETDLHRKFKNLHVRGEWFVATPELLAFIDGLLYASSWKTP